MDVEEEGWVTKMHLKDVFIPRIRVLTLSHHEQV